ncbi:ubiquitin carboxyl-terminal hydrolase 30 homolog isoform X1 [Periplaneta americana]|uniref:ubiquitin carboxyl-terminal hydrolase 30 homolog isoform X1 n=1 Tax=Periplaneta americana TaxID=6978 RepID=UPI0037E76135
MYDIKRENLFLFATVTVALAIGAFILWGPTYRRKRKGQIVGLVNLGYTCFLNTLLQALASCPVVLDWFTRQINCKQDSLTLSLQNTLQVINGKEGSDDPYTPNDLIRSLLAQGWVIAPGEQDAHELFHVIVTTMEEETQQPFSKECSLYDALNDRPREIHSDTVQVRRSTFLLRATVSSLESCSWWQEAKFKGPLPFQGLFTSQLQCMSCKYKSPVHYATFYSLSLVLPQRISVGEFHTLQELIGHYVASRVVNDVCCDGCGRRDTDQVKSLNFGKLPACLCIHIARTTWEGEAFKRDDHIKFPEILTMDPYTYNNVIQKQLENAKMMIGDHPSSNGFVDLTSPTTKKRFKHLYLLRAVVVHKGGLLCGHFITYRRGIGEYYNSWYYTSDTEVRETTLQEVMEASAYMLFYTKLSSDAAPLIVN